MSLGEFAFRVVSKWVQNCYRPIWKIGLERMFAFKDSGYIYLQKNMLKSDQK